MRQQPETDRTGTARLSYGEGLLSAGLFLRGRPPENPGGLADDNGPGWGWAAMLLPYLEQSSISSQIRFEKDITDPLNAVVRTTSLSVFPLSVGSRRSDVHGRRAGRFLAVFDPVDRRR